MSQVETRTPRSAEELAGAERLVDKVEAATGQAPLDRRGLADGPPGIGAWEAGRDTPVAYAQVTRARRWDVQLAVDPDRRPEAPELATPVLAGALEAVGAGGGGQAYLWVSRPTDADDRMAALAGFRPDRDLWQMVRPLPVEGERTNHAGHGSPIVTRPFVAGKDEPAWVEVNNRAFAWHPEQGGWTVEDVLARQAEPWFDPEGFLLHERDGRLAGFCWTKVHGQHDPPLGEIYVIAVDPDFTGLGLGRALTLAGLEHLARRGLTVGMLYVDAGNTPAVRLYESLGFTLDHVDRAYAADVPPPTGP